MAGDIVKKMMAGRPCGSNEQLRNSLREVIQEVALYGLSEAGFFDEAVFCGGTALRIFHGLDRYSEDLDFSLKAGNDGFDFREFLEPLPDVFESFGISADVSLKDKTFKSKMESAFIKSNTKTVLFQLYLEKELSEIYRTESVKVKLEIDVDPPGCAKYDYGYLLSPFPARISKFDMGTMYAGKIHAVLCRNWGHRSKGRDFFDLIYFVSNGTEMNLDYLKAKLVQSGELDAEDELTSDGVRELLMLKLDSVDIDDVKNDVLPFVFDTRSVDSWDKNFFENVVKRVR